jgi:hypothetical protein
MNKAGLINNVVSMYKRMHPMLPYRFKSTFGMNLSNYMDGLTGFDICRFDDEIVQSGDGCMEDVVRDRWGQVGVDIIKELLAL